MNNLILEKRANDFRSSNNIGASDSIRLKSLLTILNVLTVYKPLNSNFSGMAIKIGAGAEIKRFLLVNSQHPIGKQHFTICHELYHLYIQDNFLPIICNTGAFNKKHAEEYNADVFASYLLLPESGVMSIIPDSELDLNKITLKTILKIEQYYACSRTALLYRLKSLKIIDAKGYDLFATNISKGAAQYGYGTDLYRPGNHGIVIGDYGTIAKELFDDSKISESHYFSLLVDLGIDMEEIEKNGNGKE